MKREKPRKRKRKCQGIIVKRRAVFCEWGAVDFEIGEHDKVVLFTKCGGVRVILVSGTFDEVSLSLLELCANFNRSVYGELASTQRRLAVAEVLDILDGL